VFGLLNLGVVVVSLAPWLALAGEEEGALTLVGKAAEVLSAVIFAGHAVPRIKPHGA
jgi:hypothetical protein